MNWLNKLFSNESDQSPSSWDQDAVVVDVRSPGEFAGGHVDGALNIPLDRFAQSYETALPDKARQVVLYCQSGARSGQAVQFLMQMKYENVVNGRNAGTVARQLNRPIR